MYLFFDCETTGIPKKDVPLANISQPRIIELGAILVDTGGEIIEEFNAYVKPDGWEIPEYITKINGITQETCEEKGIPIAEVITKFNHMKSRSTARVGHNIVFDKTMIAREELGLGLEHQPYHGETYCTMQMMRSLGKKGKLEVMYEELFGKPFENAHTAMADVMACKEIFFKIREPA